MRTCFDAVEEFNNSRTACERFCVKSHLNLPNSALWGSICGTTIAFIKIHSAHLKVCKIHLYLIHGQQFPMLAKWVVHQKQYFAKGVLSVFWLSYKIIDRKVTLPRGISTKNNNFMDLIKHQTAFEVFNTCQRTGKYIFWLNTTLNIFRMSIQTY